MKFSQPQYIQGADKKPVYVFNVQTDEPLICSTEQQPNIDKVISEESGESYVNELYNDFITNCSKFFPRPLTIERVKSRTVHIVKTIHDDEVVDGIIVWHMTPISICVSGTQIQVYWKITKTCAIIDFEDDIPATTTAAAIKAPDVQLPITMNTLSLNEKPKDELVALDDIPSTACEEPTFVLKSHASSTASNDKVTKKLREARLQVKLAKFRAARAYEKYVNKYGDDLSESDTDTEGATTDYTTDDGSETSD